MLRFVTLDRRRFLAGTAAGALVATGPRAARAADQPKVLRVRSYSDLAILDPCYRLAAPEDDIFRCLLPALISYKPGADRWEWELEAAEEIKQLDDTTIAFRLKPGWQWTGGFGELTAEDVKFSFERIADPANKSPYHDDWSALDHVEVTGPYTGTIKLKQFFAPLWSTTLPVGSGRIVCKKAVEALPDKKFTTSVPAIVRALRAGRVAAEAAHGPAPQPRLQGPAALLRRGADPPDRRREDRRRRLPGGRARLHRHRPRHARQLQGPGAQGQRADRQALARLPLGRDERRASRPQGRARPQGRPARHRRRRRPGRRLLRPGRARHRPRGPGPDRPPRPQPHRARPRRGQAPPGRGRRQEPPPDPAPAQQDRAPRHGAGHPGVARRRRHHGRADPARTPARSGPSATRSRATGGRPCSSSSAASP